MTDKAAKEEDRRAKSEAAAKKRLDDAKQALADEREAHRQTMEVEAEKSKSELDTLLEALPAAERRGLRLKAYQTILSGEYDAGHLQARVDDMALRLVRYATEGKV